MSRSAFVTLGLAASLALIAAPAAAQHHRDGGGGGGGGEHHGSAAPRAESHRESRPATQAQPRSAPRQEQRAAPRQDYRATPRTYAPRYAAPRYYSGRYYGSRYVGPRFAIAPRRFFRPYYVFHPRLSIGFGIWAGYPITYYDPYYYPYEYAPYANVQPGYPPAPSGSVSVQPDQANMGGLSFQISPDSAEVYVDGVFFGTVGQFTPTSQPLGLTVGRHHVEIREPGYQVTSFDVDIIAGQVIPYSGELQQ